MTAFCFARVANSLLPQLHPGKQFTRPVPAGLASLKCERIILGKIIRKGGADVMTDNEGVQAVLKAIGQLEGKIKNLDARLGNVEARLGNVEARSRTVATKIDGLEAKLDQAGRSHGDWQEWG